MACWVVSCELIHSKDLVKVNPWIVAVKLPALPKILLPALAGLCLGLDGIEGVPWASIGLVLLLAICMQWSIVLLNDYADVRADTHHMRTYPELFDRRVLVEGWLRPNQVARAGGMACGGVVLCAGGLYGLGHVAVLPMAVAGLLLIWAYSFAPLRLNYRGGGEALEIVGAGILMPLIGYSAVRFDMQWDALYLLVPVVLYALIGALVSGLKHEPADRDSGKKTLCVWIGSVAVRRVVWGAQIASRLWCGLLFLSGAYGLYAMVLAALAPALPMYMTRRVDGRADYRDANALSAYKKSVQQAAYLTYGGILLDFLLS